MTKPPEEVEQRRLFPDPWGFDEAMIDAAINNFGRPEQLLMDCDTYLSFLVAMGTYKTKEEAREHLKDLEEEFDVKP